MIPVLVVIDNSASAYQVQEELAAAITSVVDAYPDAPMYVWSNGEPFPVTQYNWSEFGREGFSYWECVDWVKCMRAQYVVFITDDDSWPIPDSWSVAKVVPEPKPEGAFYVAYETDGTNPCIVIHDNDTDEEVRIPQEHVSLLTQAMVTVLQEAQRSQSGDTVESLESEWEILYDSSLDGVKRNTAALDIFRRAQALRRNPATTEAERLALFALRCDIAKECFSLTALQVAHIDSAPPPKPWTGPKSQRRYRQVDANTLRSTP